jgi:sigma-B regulation protein RsbU (phosphoserine phosphatase)
VSNAPQDPLRVLRMVNRMLCESTDLGEFATLFFGAYASASRRLTYINCGHNPPLVFRTGGAVDRLEATATVIGAFPEWDCALGRTPLAAGDLFVGYSDGLTEAARNGEHFGEERLIATLREMSSLAPARLVAALLEHVQDFCGGAPADDLTLVIARGT